ncbi:PIN domain-containing protein [Desulfonatronum lacustre]|uniref:PIN domain-containing protein n=1 Tax=Desulfonatronum lacustre TaxID=66849 RepID=UPI00048AE70B|nr:PIN domain-containing protein [Desulfonatronum lacustre]
MNVLFDTNVILDVLLDREPFADDAALLLAMVERSEIKGSICATTVTTIHYLAAKVLGTQAAMGHVRSLLALFVVAPVNRVVLESALASGFADFEDAVVHASARHVGAEYIVTRNVPDFKNAALPVLTPSELIMHMACL